MSIQYKYCHISQLLARLDCYGQKENTQNVSDIKIKEWPEVLFCFPRKSNDQCFYLNGFPCEVCGKILKSKRNIVNRLQPGYSYIG